MGGSTKSHKSTLLGRGDAQCCNFIFLWRSLFVFRLRRIECGAPHTFDPVSAVLVQQPKLGTVRQPHTIFGEKTLLQPIEQVQFTRTYCTGQTPEAHC